MNRAPTFTPANVLPTAESDTRSRQAWLASKRQELLSPAGALLELSQILLEDAADCGRPEFLHDQQAVHAAASHLLAMLHEALDPLNPAGAADHLAPCGANDARTCHDLRTPLTEIIGLCEFWLEESTDPLPQGPFGRVVEDLQTVVRLGKKLGEDISSILNFGKTASDPDIDLDLLAAGQVDLIRDLVHSLPVADGTPSAGPRETGTILVVEDNPINRDLLVRRLVRDGHTVVEAPNGRQGLALARARPFDLVLLDVIMPELNGLQMLEQLKADPHLRHLPVIMISAFHELDGVVRCLEMGAEDYLAKPFNPVLLRARIDGCLEKKRLRIREARYREEIDRQRKHTDGPRSYEDVAVLCCCVVGFTPFTANDNPEEMVALLQALIESFEEIALQYGVEKVKSSGAAFLAAAGLTAAEHPVRDCLSCAADMIAACRELPTGWDLRVGVDVGPVVAGVIGRRPPLFDLWGDTVSTAEAIQSHSLAGGGRLERDRLAARGPLLPGRAVRSRPGHGQGDDRNIPLRRVPQVLIRESRAQG